MEAEFWERPSQPRNTWDHQKLEEARMDSLLEVFMGL
jgi:hypothetical protein